MLHAQEDAAQVDVDDPVPLLLGEIGRWRDRLFDAGVVKGEVEATERCGGFVQRALRYNDEHSGIVMMGGYDAQSQPFRSSEAAIRGFWKKYRALIGN